MKYVMLIGFAIFVKMKISRQLRTNSVVPRITKRMIPDTLSIRDGSHAAHRLSEIESRSMSHLRSRFEKYCPQDQPRRKLVPASAKDAVTLGLREIQGVRAPILRPALRS